MFNRVKVLQLAFPKDSSLPTERRQRLESRAIALYGPGELFLPIGSVAARDSSATALMAVPETAVYEYHLPLSRKY
jgi:hypothetical protein